MSKSKKSPKPPKTPKPIRLDGIPSSEAYAYCEKCGSKLIPKRKRLIRYNFRNGNPIYRFQTKCFRSIVFFDGHTKKYYEKEFYNK